MAIPGLAVAGGLGLLGALAGGQGSSSTQNYTKQVGPEGEMGKAGREASLAGLEQFSQLMGLGPGAQDMQAGLDSSRGLAALLSQFSQGGFLPTQQDMTTANNLAQALFAPQQTALNQRFGDMQTEASREMARLGRGPTDSVLRAKLMQEQSRQQATLDSQRGAFGMEQAMNLPMQRLNFASQLAQVQGNLASQAMANRQTLLSLGSQLKTQDDNFRLGTASTTATTSTPGGLMGALTGGLAGLGTGMNVGSKLGLFSSQPTTTQQTSTTGGSYFNFGTVG